MSILRKLTEQVLEGRIAAPDGDAIEEKQPNLWELLTSDTYGDKEKTARMLPEMSITRVSGGYKIELKEHELCIKLTAFAGTFADIPGALEAALLDSSKVWEPFHSYRNKGGAEALGKKLDGKLKKR